MFFALSRSALDLLLTSQMFESLHSAKALEFVEQKHARKAEVFFLFVVYYSSSSAQVSKPEKYVKRLKRTHF